MSDLKLNLLLERLPLFKGLSHLELTELVGRTRLEFIQRKPKERIVEENQRCTHLIIVTDGDFRITTTAADHSFRISEQLSAPFILQPERLFGTAPHYSIQATAETVCTLLLIDKYEWMRLMEQSVILRLNFLNMLSAKIHLLERNLFASIPATLEQQLCRFFIQHSQFPTGQKRVYIKMETLSRLFHSNYQHISHTLHHLQDQQLILLQRGIINIPKIERLLQ